MKILGIDPGSLITGFGIIAFKNNSYTYVTSGCIKLPAGQLALRLHIIYNDLIKIIDKYHPTTLVIEDIFMYKNVSSAFKLGAARGVAMVAGINQGLEVVEYSAKKVKQAVVGYGNASKSQVQVMIQRLLNLQSIPAPDAADALAIALCHGYKQQSQCYDK